MAESSERALSAEARARAVAAGHAACARYQSVRPPRRSCALALVDTPLEDP